MYVYAFRRKSDTYQKTLLQKKISKFTISKKCSVAFR